MAASLVVHESHFRMLVEVPGVVAEAAVDDVERRTPAGVAVRRRDALPDDARR
jgi:hypothetical protein